VHFDRYEVIMGSDVIRDGMFLELRDLLADEPAAEVFFSDMDGSFAITRFRADVPPEIEAWLQDEARRRLPPGPNVGPSAAADHGNR
jgi:hypothetical protein